MSKYGCTKPCEWYNGGICVRNPCPYGRLRRLQAEQEEPKPDKEQVPDECDKQNYTGAVIGVDKDGNQIRFNTAAEASRALGLNKSAVTNAMRRVKGHAGGFKWRREND